MPSSVRVGSRPPSSCLIFSNSSGVRPCSRIISGVIATLIAEVVIRESLLSHLHQFFACGFLPSPGERALLSAALDVEFPRVEVETNFRVRINLTIKGGGQECPPRTRVYTVADEVRHRRHRRTYRSRQDGARESPDRHRCRSPGRGKAARHHH